MGDIKTTFPSNMKTYFVKRASCQPHLDTQGCFSVGRIWKMPDGNDIYDTVIFLYVRLGDILDCSIIRGAKLWLRILFHRHDHIFGFGAIQSLIEKRTKGSRKCNTDSCCLNTATSQNNFVQYNTTLLTIYQWHMQNITGYRIRQRQLAHISLLSMAT